MANITNIRFTGFTELPKPLRLKGVENIYSLNDDQISILDLDKINDDLEYKVTTHSYSAGTNVTITHDVRTKNAIVFQSGADDIRRRKLDNGLTIVSSCDAFRGYIILEDNTVYLVSPYYVWDDFGRLDNPTLEDIKPEAIYAKGFIKGRLVTITHIKTNANN